MNESGIIPTGFKCLIEPTAVEEKTAGGIYIPDDVKTKNEFATTEGVIVAMSPLAFTYVTADEWGDAKPQVGQRVAFTKYGGMRVKSKRTGKDYLLIKDEDIHATIEE